MLPCQQSCPHYQPGCHKTCASWKAFQSKQEAQRQKKKAYLSYYNDVCATMIRQLSALEARRPIIG